MFADGNSISDKVFAYLGASYKQLLHGKVTNELTMHPDTIKDMPHILFEIRPIRVEASPIIKCMIVFIIRVYVINQW